MPKATNRSSKLHQAPTPGEDNLNDGAGQTLLPVDAVDAKNRIVRYKPSPNPHAPMLFDVTDKDDELRPTATRQLHLDSESEQESDESTRRRSRRNRLVPPTLPSISEHDTAQDEDTLPTSDSTTPPVSSCAESSNNSAGVEEGEVEKQRTPTRRLCVSRLTPSKRASARLRAPNADEATNTGAAVEGGSAAVPTAVSLPTNVVSSAAHESDDVGDGASGDVSPLARSAHSRSSARATLSSAAAVSNADINTPSKASKAGGRGARAHTSETESTCVSVRDVSSGDATSIDMEDDGEGNVPAFTLSPSPSTSTTLSTSASGNQETPAPGIHIPMPVDPSPSAPAPRPAASTPIPQLRTSPRRPRLTPGMSISERQGNIPDSRRGVRDSPASSRLRAQMRADLEDSSSSRGSGSGSGNGGDGDGVVEQMSGNAYRSRVHAPTPMKRRGRAALLAADAAEDEENAEEKKKKKTAKRDTSIGDEVYEESDEVSQKALLSRKHAPTPMKRRGRNVLVLKDEGEEEDAQEKDEELGNLSQVGKKSVKHRAPTPGLLRRSSRIQTPIVPLEALDGDMEGEMTSNTGKSSFSGKLFSEEADDEENAGDDDFSSIRHVLALDDADMDTEEKTDVSENITIFGKVGNSEDAVSMLDRELAGAVCHVTPVKSNKAKKDTRSRLSTGTPRSAATAGVGAAPGVDGECGDGRGLDAVSDVGMGISAAVATVIESPRRSRRLSSVGLPVLTPQTLQRSRSFDMMVETEDRGSVGALQEALEAEERDRERNMSEKEEEGEKKTARVHKSTPRKTRTGKNLLPDSAIPDTPRIAASSRPKRKAAHSPTMSPVTDNLPISSSTSIPAFSIADADRDAATSSAASQFSDMTANMGAPATATTPPTTDTAMDTVARAAGALGATVAAADAVMCGVERECIPASMRDGAEDSQAAGEMKGKSEEEEEEEVIGAAAKRPRLALPTAITSTTASSTDLSGDTTASNKSGIHATATSGSADEAQTPVKLPLVIPHVLPDGTVLPEGYDVAVRGDAEAVMDGVSVPIASFDDAVCTPTTSATASPSASPSSPTSVSGYVAACASESPIAATVFNITANHDEETSLPSVDVTTPMPSLPMPHSSVGGDQHGYSAEFGADVVSESPLEGAVRPLGDVHRPLDESVDCQRQLAFDNSVSMHDGDEDEKIGDEEVEEEKERNALEGENLEVCALQDISQSGIPSTDGELPRYSLFASALLAQWHSLSLGTHIPSSSPRSPFPPCIKPYHTYSNANGVYAPPPRPQRPRRNITFANVSVCELDLWPDWGKVPCDDSEAYSIGLSPYPTAAYLRTIDDYETWKETRGAVSAQSVCESERRYAWYKAYVALKSYVDGVGPLGVFADYNTHNSVPHTPGRKLSLPSAENPTCISGIFPLHNRIFVHGVWGRLEDDNDSIVFDSFDHYNPVPQASDLDRRLFVEYQRRCMMSYTAGDQPFVLVVRAALLKANPPLFQPHVGTHGLLEAEYQAVVASEEEDLQEETLLHDVGDSAAAKAHEQHASFNYLRSMFADMFEYLYCVNSEEDSILVDNTTDTINTDTSIHADGHSNSDGEGSSSIMSMATPQKELRLRPNVGKMTFGDFSDRGDLTQLRSARRHVGCQCQSCGQDDDNFYDNDGNTHKSSSSRCECELHGINCMGDACGCDVNTCTNSYGRYEFDDAKVVNFTYKVVRMANKYIMQHRMWSKRQERLQAEAAAVSGAGTVNMHGYSYPTHATLQNNSSTSSDDNTLMGVPAFSTVSSLSSMDGGAEVDIEPCNYGIPPLRADALRLKLSRLLPPTNNRIPPHNVLHVLPAVNLMAWRQSDDEEEEE